MKGATQDGCHRQVNLSTGEQRHAGQHEAEGPFQSDELAVFFWIRICTSDVSLCLLLRDCVLKMLFFIVKKMLKGGQGGGKEPPGNHRQEGVLAHAGGPDLAQVSRALGQPAS